MIPARLTTALLSTALLSTACLRPTPQADGPAAPPTHTVPMASTAPVIKTVTVYRPDPLKSWPFLFLERDDAARGDVALERDHLVVTRAELLAAAEDDPTSPGDATRVEDLLATDLLLLAYLRDEGLLADPAFEARARAHLRRELASMALGMVDERARSVTAQEIRDRYDRDIARYRTPGLATVRLIVVATASEADALKSRIEAGESFAALAEQFSQHPSRTEGGELEPFPPGTYSPAIEEVVFSLPTGALGEVSTSRGVFLIQKIAESSPQTIPLEAVRNEIEATLLAEKRAAARAAFLARLENRAGG